MGWWVLTSTGGWLLGALLILMPGWLDFYLVTPPAHRGWTFYIFGAVSLDSSSPAFTWVVNPTCTENC